MPDTVGGDIVKKNCSILLVDDDTKLLEIHAAVFRDAGFDVTTAEDGAAAWALLESGERPDIVMTGIRMPKMSGFDLFQKMRADAALRATPVVVYSHQGMQEHAAMAKRLGAAQFIVRSQTSPGEVLRIVRQTLGTARRLKLSFARELWGGVEAIRLIDRAGNSNFAADQTKRLILVVEPIADQETFRLRFEEHE